jgi:hypothetical protein
MRDRVSRIGWIDIAMQGRIIVGLSFALIAFSSHGVGLAQGTTSSLVGVWKLDSQRTYKAMKASGGHDVLMTYFGEGALRMRFEFRSDGKVKHEVRLVGEGIDIPPAISTGVWQVLDEKKRKLTLELEFDGGEDDSEGKTVVRFLDANTIRMESLDSKFERRHPLILRRADAQARN